MKRKPIPNIKTPCRFCGAEIWAQEDDKEPECYDCDDLANAAFQDSFEIEATLEPITETGYWPE